VRGGLGGRETIKAGGDRCHVLTELYNPLGKTLAGEGPREKRKSRAKMEVWVGALGDDEKKAYSHISKYEVCTKKLKMLVRTLGQVSNFEKSAKGGCERMGGSQWGRSLRPHLGFSLRVQVVGRSEKRQCFSLSSFRARGPYQARGVSVWKSTGEGPLYQFVASCSFILNSRSGGV